MWNWAKLMKTARAALILCVLAKFGSCQNAANAAQEPSPPVVATRLGSVEGVSGDRGVRVFRGIPYAAPPVGALRWKAPQPAASWQGLRDASKDGPSCPTPEGVAMTGKSSASNAVHGPDYDIWLAKAAPGGSEDCLTLSIWAPPAAAKNAPVMVFLSPTGNAALPIFDGTAFARDGVILVIPNNRLFTQTTFAHPALTHEAAPNEPYTRFADLDRIMALEWVRDNIASFGGDPHNVTLFGQSNSGVSVLLLMTAPKAKGLFQRAIVQSGSSWGAPLSRAAMERIGIAMANMAGLDGRNATAEQLRALPLDALPFVVAGTLDERLFARNVTDSFARGKEQRIPLLIGGNSWDGSSLRYPPATIVERTPMNVLQAYANEGLSGDALGYALYTDEHVNAPARWYAAAHAAHGAPAYHYVFSHVTSFRKNQPGAAHGEELPYVFDSWDTIPGVSGILTDADRRVAKTMHDCWIAFAKTGHPDCDGVPEWPAYDDRSRVTMELNATPTVRAQYRSAQYAAQEHEAELRHQSARDGREVLEALEALKRSK